MRLAGKRPPSTVGRTASMTARTRPSANRRTAGSDALGASPSTRVRAAAPALLLAALALRLATAFPAQHDGRQRRQREAQATRRGHAQLTGTDSTAPRLPQPEPPYSRASVLRISRHRPRAGTPTRKFARGIGVKLHTTSNGAPSLAGLAQKRDDAHFRIADIHPLESFGRKIDLMQAPVRGDRRGSDRRPALDAGVLRAARTPTTPVRPRASIRAAARIRRP